MNEIDLDTEQYLTVREAAERFSLHPDTVWTWVRKGVLPHERVGPGRGLIRIRQSELVRTVKPSDRRRVKLSRRR